MIRIRYEKNRCRVTVRGHAASAPAGEDLVCAACSALVYTLGENLRQLEQQGKLPRWEAEVRSGWARFRWDSGQSREPEPAVEAVCRGFRLLGRMYPEFVAYEER